MKKWLLILCCVLFLTGCHSEVFETVDDSNDIEAMANPAQLLLELPKEAAVPVMNAAGGKLYFCDGYDVTVEVLSAGNLDETLRFLTGFGREDLEMLQTKRCGADCYEGVWSAAGEAGDQVGRFLVLDDGSFHYCVTVLAPAQNAAQSMDAWNGLLDSVKLAEG
jgi:hypothetical protein